MSTDDLSPIEREKIEEEVREAFSSVVGGCELLDVDAAFEVFLDSPEFVMIGADGTLCDYRQYVDNNVSYLRTCSSFKLTTLNEQIRVYDRRLAILSWIYKAEATLKTGERDLFESAGATFVFAKIGEEWKVVHYHESALPPTRVPGG